MVVKMFYCGDSLICFVFAFFAGFDEFVHGDPPEMIIGFKFLKPLNFSSLLMH